MGCKKQDAKNRLPLLFLNNNNPVYLQPAFFNPYFEPFLKVPDPKKISGQPEKLE